MKKKKLLFLIVGLILLFLIGGLSLTLYQKHQSKKNTQLVYKIPPQATYLVKDPTPVSQIKIGKTYVLYGKKQDGKNLNDTSWYNLYKFVNDHTYLFLDDYSKVPEGIPEKLDNSRSLSIESGEYHKEGGNYIFSPTTRNVTIYFTSQKNGFNKQGSWSEELPNFKDTIYNCIKKDNFYWLEKEGEPSKFGKHPSVYLSTLELPNSVDEFLAEYTIKQPASENQASRETTE